MAFFNALFESLCYNFELFEHFCFIVFGLNMKQCELKTNIDAKSYFEREIFKMDAEILALNLSKPALRALILLNVYSLLDLSKISKESLKNAHRLGSSSLMKIRCLLEMAFQEH